MNRTPICGCDVAAIAAAAAARDKIAAISGKSKILQKKLKTVDRI